MAPPRMRYPWGAIDWRPTDVFVFPKGGERPQVWPSIACYQLHTTLASFCRGHYALLKLWFNQRYWAEESQINCGAIWPAIARNYGAAARTVKRGEGYQCQGPGTNHKD